MAIDHRNVSCLIGSLDGAGVIFYTLNILYYKASISQFSMDFPVKLSSNMLKIATELRIAPEDIEEHAVRGGGPGGQKINKTNSCIELHHKPTKTDVRVQKHREQSRNRLAAYILLIRKIEEKKLGKKSAIQQKQFKLRKQKQRRSRKAKEKILQEKHHRSETKETRKPIV